MVKLGKKIGISLVMILAAFTVMGSPLARAAEMKIGYVDIRKVFYDYEKRKTMEGEIDKLTEERQKEHNGKVEEITKLRDEAELLTGDAKINKEKQIEEKMSALQARSEEIKKELLGKKNDMFKEVIDDIQKSAEAIGKAEGYDYVFDSRNVMYAKEAYDITEKVLKALNKK